MVLAATITAAGTAPAPTLTAEVFSGSVLAFAGTAPTPTLSSETKDVRGTAPAPSLIATLLPGTIIMVEARAAAPILVATLTSPTIITARGTAPAPRLTATFLAGHLLDADLVAPSPSLSARLLTGNVATFLGRAAAPIMEAAGYPAYTITFAGVAPAPRLDAELLTTIAEHYRTWVLNTRKSSLSEYDNFSFNSYAQFNGKVLACGPSGVFELGLQGTDAGTAIDATVTFGQESFASSLHKRVPRIYLGHVADGDLRFSTITTEGGTRTYALDWNGVSGTQQRRIPVGKGPRSRFWQFSVSNVDGADFELNDLLVYVTRLRRRVE